MLLFMLLALGACAGFLAGLLGIGGGAVLVPGLFYIFNFLGFPAEPLMHMAVGTSLAIIVPTGLSSVRAHWRKGAVDVSLVIRIGGGIVAGVCFGTVLASWLSGQSLKLIFAITLSVLAVFMIAGPDRFKGSHVFPSQPWPSFAGFVIGGVSSLIGIGGATMSVPYMSVYGIPIHRAIGTAAALGLLISIPAALGFMWTGWLVEGRPLGSIGYVHLPAWACVIAASVMCAPLGAKVSHKIPVGMLRNIFAAFMIIVALKMAWSAL